MKKMYAPWRAEYGKKVTHEKNEHATEDECTFCIRMKKGTDEDNLILKRSKLSILFLNRYPYNAGHLLVLPNRHVNSLDKLTSKERTEIMESINEATLLVQQTLNAQGVNIGLNQGKAAGAGIPAHLHFHILPRWAGDTNFLPVLANTKQISFDLHEIYTQLKKGLNNKD